MSQNEDTAALVRTLIVNHLGVDDDAATDEASFCDDLGADSLDCVELLMAAEEQFTVEISDDEAEKISTVGEAIRLIDSKIGARAAA